MWPVVLGSSTTISNFTVSQEEWTTRLPGAQLPAAGGDDSSSRPTQPCREASTLGAAAIGSGTQPGLQRAGRVTPPREVEVRSDVATASVRDLIGVVIDERYEVRAILGEGGMGIVYRVRHATLGREFALKMLRAELASDALLAARFLREAQSAAAVSHPAVCEITDFGRWDGRPYFVMELLTAESLREELTRRGRLPLIRALQVAFQVADALHAAHLRGVVHRDLKPENILLLPSTHADAVKIVDFGLAYLTGQSRLTQRGLVHGTPHYMSPEQAMGAEVSAASDIYSLGILLFEMSTGRPPFEGTNHLQVLSQHFRALPPSPSSAAADAELVELDAIVLRCLAKEPAARYATMADVAEALRGMLAERQARRAFGSLFVEYRRTWLVVALAGLAFGGGVVVTLREPLGLGDAASEDAASEEVPAREQSASGDALPNARAGGSQSQGGGAQPAPSGEASAASGAAAVLPPPRVIPSSSVVQPVSQRMRAASGEGMRALALTPKQTARHTPAPAAGSNRNRAHPAAENSATEQGAFRRPAELVNPWSK